MQGNINRHRCMLFHLSRFYLYFIHYASTYMKGKEKRKPKIQKVMSEFKHGNLHSGSKKGPIVKSKDQAIAIAMSESRKGKKK